jgi:hypothetical protein
MKPVVIVASNSVTRQRTGAGNPAACAHAALGIEL